MSCASLLGGGRQSGRFLLCLDRGRTSIPSDNDNFPDLSLRVYQLFSSSDIGCGSSSSSSSSTTKKRLDKSGVDLSKSAGIRFPVALRYPDLTEPHGADVCVGVVRQHAMNGSYGKVKANFSRHESHRRRPGRNSQDRGLCPRQPDHLGPVGQRASISVAIRIDCH